MKGGGGGGRGVYKSNQKPGQKKNTDTKLKINLNKVLLHLSL